MGKLASLLFGALPSILVLPEGYIHLRTKEGIAVKCLVWELVSFANLSPKVSPS